MEYDYSTILTTPTVRTSLRAPTKLFVHPRRVAHGAEIISLSSRRIDGREAIRVEH